ncbi:MAG: methionine--tRNA ligase [Nanoarchaeota archaeon]
MKNKKTFYITTPIYYPNDVPHLGHAYTTIAADVLARWHKLLGEEVFLLTGTDEHGKKIAKAAERAGKKPKEFTDSLIPEFKRAWKILNIDYDRFIRTTDREHEKTVQEIIEKVFKSGDIYKGTYEGLYCTDCEAYYTEKDSLNLQCPIHKRQLETLKEESYFFKLSKYQSFLLDLYKKNPEFISPSYRRQEIINRVKGGLRDFSVSRTSFDWGIQLPFDKKHYAYVWFDALINYISGVGYLDKKKQFNKFWPADIHLIGKDILWFHSVYWPAMLKSAGIEMPKKIFAHGFLTIQNEKMGKSAGNAINVGDLVSYAGSDPARYFLLRSTPFGDDGDFSKEALIDRHNNELANKLGNLVSRVSALAEKYGLEKTALKTLDSERIVKKVAGHLDNLEFDKALNEIFSFVDKCNEFIQAKKPWETHDSKVLYESGNAIKDISILLFPFMPETSEKIARTFSFEIELGELKKPLKVSKIKKSEILFERI